jgi:apolipoprotein N-acyltransferase
MLYAQRLSLLAWIKEWGGSWLACILSFGLLWMSHAPRQTPEAAYIFLLPVLIWFHFRPGYRKVLICLLLSGWAYQIAMVGWMRHVSFGGMCTATFLLSFYQAIWYVVARMLFSWFSEGGLKVRILVLVALSSLWVAVEWGRTLFTLGFPWCPLSVTQWERPVLLQASSYAGGWVVSFFLVFFNLCVGSYLHHLLIRRRKAEGFFNRSICPELYLGILMLFLMVYPFFSKFNTKDNFPEKTIRVGICQPYLQDKWEEGRAVQHKETLRKQTQFLAHIKPDVILWPEASTPYPINLDRLWVEELAKNTGIPILAGSVIREDEASYNAMTYIDPVDGMQPEWYAKQVLVPFGEYIPWPFSLIPGIKKMVGPVGSFSAGDHPLLFDIPIHEGNRTSFVRAGFLICYEDIFPAIARKSRKFDADLLIVSTNDAWFAEEGCAEQHASHSVIRAVENHLPVVRCGNAGWSGWIDEYGRVRDVLKNEQGSIYFEGATVLDVKVPILSFSPHSPLGDQFAYLCTGLFFAILLYCLMGTRKRCSAQ